MAATYLYPTITSLPPGYDVTAVLPLADLAASLVNGTGVVDYYCRVLFEGECRSETGGSIAFEDGKLAGDAPPDFRWEDAATQWNGGSGYAEIGFLSRADKPIFFSKRVVSFYAIYSKPGRKSFFSDNSYKYGSPPVITQIATFGRYVDGYPVIHLDRARDLGETLTLINPYAKPIFAGIRTHDGRAMERIRIPAGSARNVRLVDLLKSGETEWLGQLQLTATNRLIAYHIKHSLSDPTLISDHEHLDPYRDDPTYIPATEFLRDRLVRFLKRRQLFPSLWRRR